MLNTSILESPSSRPSLLKNGSSGGMLIGLPFNDDDNAITFNNMKSTNTTKKRFIHSPDVFLSSPNKRIYLQDMSPNVQSKTIYIPTSNTAASKRLDLSRPPLLKPPIQPPSRSKSSISFSRPSLSPKRTLRRANSLISQGGSFSSSDNQQQSNTTSSDRFIPSRHNSTSNKLQTNISHPLPNDSPQTHIKIQTSKMYQHHVAEACGLEVNSRVLLYQPLPPERKKPINLFSSFNQSKKGSKSIKPAAASIRVKKVPTAPERVLDAPGLVDDFYLNLLAWSSTNLLAIGLENAVYVWNASTGSVGLLCELANNCLVTSLRWSEDGSYISIGKDDGKLEIWDISKNFKLRTLNCDNHQTRIASQSWSQHILTSGSRIGNLYHSDVREAKHLISKNINTHSAEICGIEYRADGQQFATGGNDNLVCIWDVRQAHSNVQQPLFSKNTHKAAIKALSWCPHQSNLLATGGGSSDKSIHFWNTNTGARVNSITTDSQISSLNWGYAQGTGLEIVATHGFPSNNISLYSYPTLQKTGEIVRAHDSRLLNGCLSPDNLTLATVSGDENLKFWSLFDLYKPKDRESSDSLEDKAELGITNDKTKKMMNLR